MGIGISHVNDFIVSNPKDQSMGEYIFELLKQMSILASQDMCLEEYTNQRFIDAVIDHLQHGVRVMKIGTLRFIA